ncbi:MAG TPA: YlxR family protein [Solirubrobacteraceae bacterium]|nr:YlxR family protein [Solirubrobacteraceae bacterium]
MVPRRRCVGCGRVTSKPELIRIVAVPSDTDRPTATLDPAGTLPGRGAYVCQLRATGAANPACLRLATRKGGLQRALHRAVDVPAELIGAGPLESEGR